MWTSISQSHSGLVYSSALCPGSEYTYFLCVFQEMFSHVQTHKDYVYILRFNYFVLLGEVNKQELQISGVGMKVCDLNQRQSDSLSQVQNWARGSQKGRALAKPGAMLVRAAWALFGSSMEEMPSTGLLLHPSRLSPKLQNEHLCKNFISPPSAFKNKWPLIPCRFCFLGSFCFSPRTIILRGSLFLHAQTFLSPSFPSI